MSTGAPRTVVHFSDSEAFGGTERALLQLAAGLDRARWRSVVFHADVPGARRLADEAAARGIPTFAVERGASPARGIASIPALARAFRRERAAVFHAHQTWSLSCRYAIVAAALARVPARVASAQLFLEMPANRAIDAQHALLSACLHRHVAVSRHVAARLRERFGVAEEKITVIPNAVELREPSASRREVRASLGIADETPLVVTVARLEPQKGLPYLVEAAAGVPDTTFAVAGEGPERTSLERRIADLGLARRVRLLGHRDDVPALVAAADLFVLPSLNEGLPLSVMEAMAAGIPVIATDAGGTSEIVRDGVTGLLIPPADPAALRGAIGALLHDRARAAQLAEAGRVLVEREHSAATMAEATSRLYDTLLAR